jgi:hypothetical protein
MNATPVLTKLRHPVVVQSDSEEYAAAADYEPPAQVVSDLLKGLAWGYQEPKPGHGYRGHRYMVYDEMGHHVLGSGSTPKDAAQKATENLRSHALPLEIYSPRLKGCKFGFLENDSSINREFTVIDENDVVVGVGETHQSATRMATRNIMVKQNTPDMIFDEFRCTTFAASAVIYTASKRMGGETRGLFSGDSRERNAIRKALAQMWKISPTGRAQYPTADEFVDAQETQMLGAIGQGKGDLFTYEFDLDQLKLDVVFILTNRCTPDEAMRLLYADYVKQTQKSTDSEAPVPQGEASSMFAGAVDGEGQPLVGRRNGPTGG